MEGLCMRQGWRRCGLHSTLFFLRAARQGKKLSVNVENHLMFDFLFPPVNPLVPSRS